MIIIKFLRTALLALQVSNAQTDGLRATNHIMMSQEMLDASCTLRSLRVR